jgi:hypothetical protein
MSHGGDQAHAELYKHLEEAARDYFNCLKENWTQGRWNQHKDKEILYSIALPGRSNSVKNHIVLRMSPGAHMTLCTIILEMPCIWRLLMSKIICLNTIYHSRTNLEICSPTAPNKVNGDSSPSWQNPLAPSPADSGITNTPNMVVEENCQVYYKQYESQ